MTKQELIATINKRLEVIREHCDPACFNINLEDHSIEDLLYVYGKISVIEAAQYEMFEKIGD